jgi:hypothetical protein
MSRGRRAHQSVYLRVVHRWIILATVLAACGSSGDASTQDDAPESTAATASPSAETSVTSTTVPAATTATETPAATTSPPPSSTTTTTTPEVRPDTLGAELVGRWAHYDVVAYEDDAIKTLIISYGFNDFTVVDNQLVDQASFCFSEQRTDQPIETSLSDAATRAIRPPPTPVDVATNNNTLTISRPATPTPVGIRLDDPANEQLPTDPNDPRIVDDDGDGNPGITVTIQVTPDLTGELYIARREIFAYEAAQVAPDRLEGSVTDDSEQLVIGASDPLFLADSDWRQYPDPTKSPIILIRVDDTWGCEQLAAERDTLFPPTPDVDW